MSLPASPRPRVPVSRSTRRLRKLLRAMQLSLLITAGALNGCAYYSFTGATIPAHLNSIALPLADDNSTSPLATLDEQLTDRLTERFVRQTRLSFEENENNADAVLAATIDRYRNQETAVTGQERAALNRVTISVSVRYYDQVEDDELMQRTFRGSEEYDPIAEGLEGERQAAAAALENIADDVFTAATSNW